MGLGLGVFYCFLRPLRQRHTHFADTLFVCGTFYAWIYLGFGICAGDLRFGYTAGLLGGAMLLNWACGRVLAPVFAAFWRVVGKIFLPLKKIWRENKKILKKGFAIGKKWVTISKNTRRAKTRQDGGIAHGRQNRTHRTDSAGVSPQPHADEMRRADDAPAMHRRPADPARRHHGGKRADRNAAYAGSAVGAKKRKSHAVHQ